MPLSKRPLRTKTIAFFHGMISGEFAAYRTYDSDMESVALVKTLVDSLDDNEGDSYPRFIEFYAECVVYTQAMTFDWYEDTPPEIRKFEIFWNMVKEGETPVACFAYYTSHVPTSLIMATTPKHKVGIAGWSEAKKEALNRWEPPPEWKLEDELTDEEKADPLSSSGDSKSA